MRLLVLLSLLAIAACAPPHTDCPEPTDGGIGGTGIEVETMCK